MTTDAIVPSHSRSSETNQARLAQKRQHLNILRDILVGFDTNIAMTKSPTPSLGTAIYQTTPQIEEVNRQISRMRAALACAEESSQSSNSLEDLTSSINMLSSLACSPLPVPVAAWSAGNGPSLFFQENGFYGDLEIRDKTVEYLLKWSDSNGPVEIYDNEEITDTRLPPKLLTHLYRAFARSNAGML